MNTKQLTQGNDIARMLRGNVDAAREPSRRAEGYRTEATRVRKSADAMRDRAGHVGVANAYDAAADLLEAWAAV